MAENGKKKGSKGMLNLSGAFLSDPDGEPLQPFKLLPFHEGLKLAG